MEYRGDEMDKYYENKKLQLIIGLFIGIVFGFLLQKGGVTKYDVIVGQLRLTDFTVIKIIFSAIITTMLGIGLLYKRGLIKVETKSGSIKNSIIGGLLFGIGFGLLGYCPGTIAGAIGNGYVDAMTGGFIGILAGTAIYAFMHPTLRIKGIIKDDKYSEYNIFNNYKGNIFTIIIPISLLLMGVMFIVENMGL